MGSTGHLPTTQLASARRALSDCWKELRYEIERGMMQGEIDEHLGYRFVVPISKKIPGGVVIAEFRTRPVPRYATSIDDLGVPRLRVVK